MHALSAPTVSLALRQVNVTVGREVFTVSLRTHPPSGSGSYDDYLRLDSQHDAVFVHRRDNWGRTLQQGSLLRAGGVFLDVANLVRFMWQGKRERNCMRRACVVCGVWCVWCVVCGV